MSGIRLRSIDSLSGTVPPGDNRFGKIYEWLDRAPTGFAGEALRSSLR